MRPRTAIQLAGWVLAGVGLAILALGGAPGALVVLLGLLVLASVNRSAYVIAASGLLPATTVGWSLSLVTIDGRPFDTRLLLTFGVAATSVILASTWFRRFDVLDWLAVTFVGYLVVDGLVQTGSVFIWGPPVARWAAYLATMAVARRTLGSRLLQRRLVLAVALGFLPTILAGSIQFLSGAANEQNSAIRATGFINTSPIGLAFAGQAVIFALYPLAERARSQAARASWLLGMAVGAFGILASATRIILATAYLGLAALVAARRQWVALAAVTLILVGSLAVRPDFLGRFLVLAPTSSVPATPSPGASPSTPSSPLPGDAEVPATTFEDTSLQYRVFVWRTLLHAWSKTPILGIGPGMAASTIEAASPTSHRQAPHNDYVGALAEAGVIGLGLFLTVQLAFLFVLWRRRNGLDAWDADFARMVLIALLMTNVLGALNNPTYAIELQVGLWATVGAAIGPSLRALDKPGDAGSYRL